MFHAATGRSNGRNACRQCVEPATAFESSIPEARRAEKKPPKPCMSPSRLLTKLALPETSTLVKQRISIVTASTGSLRKSAGVRSTGLAL